MKFLFLFSTYLHTTLKASVGKKKLNLSFEADKMQIPRSQMVYSKITNTDIKFFHNVNRVLVSQCAVSALAVSQRNLQVRVQPEY